MGDLLALAGLFLACFAAATVLPFQSEVALFALLVADLHPWWLLIAVASVGNTLGSAANWGLGRLLLRLEGRRWFPIRRASLARAEGWYARYGRWSLLLSWAPFVGDPLTVVAGLLREPFPTFLVLVAIAKTVRYLVVAALASGWA